MLKLELIKLFKFLIFLIFIFCSDFYTEAVCAMSSGKLRICMINARKFSIISCLVFKEFLLHHFACFFSHHTCDFSLTQFLSLSLLLCYAWVLFFIFFSSSGKYKVSRKYQKCATSICLTLKFVGNFCSW